MERGGRGGSRCVWCCSTKRELRACEGIELDACGHVDFPSSGIFFGEGACSCVLEMILLSLAVHRTIPPFCLFRRGVDLSQSPLKWESIHKNPFSSFSLFLE